VATTGSCSGSGRTSTRGFDLVKSESLAITGRHCDVTGNVASGFNTINPVWFCSRMTRGNCVHANERQAREYELTLLDCLHVIIRFHVSPEDVDLCISQGNLLTGRLLHPNMTT